MFAFGLRCDIRHSAFGRRVRDHAARCLRIRNRPCRAGPAGNPSRCFRVLLAFRDALVVPFRVKTSAQLRAQVKCAAASHIGFFPVISRTADEVVIGADDRHLDFRTSVLVRRNALVERCKVIVTMVVHSHNRFGQLYLLVIAPFHLLVVRSNLQRAGATGWKSIA